jgi:hypothetical protein
VHGTPTVSSPPIVFTATHRQRRIPTVSSPPTFDWDECIFTIVFTATHRQRHAPTVSSPPIVFTTTQELKVGVRRYLCVVVKTMDEELKVGVRRCLCVVVKTMDEELKVGVRRCLCALVKTMDEELKVGATTHRQRRTPTVSSPPTFDWDECIHTILFTATHRK